MTWVDILKKVLQNSQEKEFLSTPPIIEVTQKELRKISEPIAEQLREAAQSINRLMKDEEIEAKASYTFDIHGGAVLISVRDPKDSEIPLAMAENFDLIRTSDFIKNNFGGKDWYTAWFGTKDSIGNKKKYKIVESHD